MATSEDLELFPSFSVGTLSPLPEGSGSQKLHDKERQSKVQNLAVVNALRRTFPKNFTECMQFIKSYSADDVSTALELDIEDTPARIRCIAHWLGVKNALSRQSNVRYMLAHINKQAQFVKSGGEIEEPAAPIPSDLLVNAMAHPRGHPVTPHKTKAFMEETRAESSVQDRAEVVNSKTEVVKGGGPPQVSPLADRSTQRMRNFLDLIKDTYTIMGEKEDMDKIWNFVEMMRGDLILPGRGYYPGHVMYHITVQPQYEEELGKIMRKQKTTSMHKTALSVEPGTVVNVFRRKEFAQDKSTNPMTTLETVLQGAFPCARVGGNAFIVRLPNDSCLEHFCETVVPLLHQTNFLASFKGKFLEVPGGPKRSKDGESTWPVYLSYMDRNVGGLIAAFMCRELNLQYKRIQLMGHKNKAQKWLVVVAVHLGTEQERQTALESNWVTPFGDTVKATMAHPDDYQPSTASNVKPGNPSSVPETRTKQATTGVEIVRREGQQNDTKKRGFESDEGSHAAGLRSTTKGDSADDHDEGIEGGSKYPPAHTERHTHGRTRETMSGNSAASGRIPTVNLSNAPP